MTSCISKKTTATAANSISARNQAIVYVLLLLKFVKMASGCISFLFATKSKVETCTGFYGSPTKTALLYAQKNLTLSSRIIILQVFLFGYLHSLIFLQPSSQILVNK
mmetsp:Transcript_16116/g.18228  ORF Transcript_16116/g.18228 Transcript_16116/m.18228 type:complete len:107 (-) Transcript_16116:57-377(-)